MATSTLGDYYYRSNANLDKLNPLIRSAYNTTVDFQDYKQQLLKRVELNTQHNDESVLDSIEAARLEQRSRLAQIERDYYNRRPAVAYDIPVYAEQVEQQSALFTSNTPLDTVTRHSPSLIVPIDKDYEHYGVHRPISMDIAREYDDSIESRLYPAQADDTQSTVNDLPSDRHVECQVHNIWNEHELDKYLDKTR
jgi:hypothetical protein